MIRSASSDSASGLWSPSFMWAILADSYQDQQRAAEEGPHFRCRPNYGNYGSMAEWSAQLFDTGAILEWARLTPRLRERLAAVVVGHSTVMKPTRIPPVQQAAAVGVPTADGGNWVVNTARAWLIAWRLGMQSPAAGHESDDQCPKPSVAFHKVPLSAGGGLLGLRLLRR
jgi:hypothetical protein